MTIRQSEREDGGRVNRVGDDELGHGSTLGPTTLLYRLLAVFLSIGCRRLRLTSLCSQGQGRQDERFSAREATRAKPA